MSLVGRQIGRYRILEQLGQGGMSIVYKGLDTALDREVAVKVLHPHLAQKQESRKRLEREAKAVARLHHPNILEVFDFAAADAQDAYIVTEYIRGKTVRQFLSEQSLEPPEVAAMVVHEIASALAHAHDSGVIHRDLKPENVMLRDDGVLKLMDFGIAKILDRDEKMTMTGALVGSPAHMAPEIIEGEEAGPEADVFSLGTMLYLFATGRLPFTASNTTATLKRILDCVYDDPRQVQPLVSDELAEIIAMCLSRKPQDRYPTAGKLRDVLQAWLSEMGLTRIHEELPRFFSNPGQYRNELKPRVTHALLGRSEKLIAEKRPARALSVLNQVLAWDPTNAQALTMLSAMKASRARSARNRKMVRFAVVSGVVFCGVMGGAKGWQLATRAEDFSPPLFKSPGEVRMAASFFPPVPTEVIAPPAVVEPPSVVDHPPAVAIEMKKLPLKVKPSEVARPQPLPGVTAETVPVSVTVRPFGLLTVDGLPVGGDARARYELKLTPGKHSFKVGCDDFCVPSGRVAQLDVQQGKPNELMIAAPLKSSLLMFSGFPSEAVVRVGAEQRTVGETQARPFEIQAPPEGSPRLLHVVRYEVFKGDEKIASGTEDIQPGKPATITPRKGAP